MVGKRELINTGTDKRYVRRNDKGQINESDDVGRSLRQDVKRKAKTVVKAGHGDKGDQKRKVSKRLAGRWGRNYSKNGRNDSLQSR